MNMGRNLLNLEIKNIIKIIKKNYKFQSRQNTLFKKIGEYFLVVNLFATGIKGNKFIITAHLKPYICDDIFWEVFDMTGNKKEPMSLRAVGAFCVTPLTIFEQIIIVTDIQEMLPFANLIISDIEENSKVLIQKFNKLEDFYDYSKQIQDISFYDGELVNMLINIHNRNYSNAKKLAEDNLMQNIKGRFANDGKYIYEYILDYCKERI